MCLCDSLQIQDPACTLYALQIRTVGRNIYIGILARSYIHVYIHVPEHSNHTINVHVLKYYIHDCTCKMSEHVCLYK